MKSPQSNFRGLLNHEGESHRRTVAIPVALLMRNELICNGDLLMKLLSRFETTQKGILDGLSLIRCFGAS